MLLDYLRGGAGRCTSIMRALDDLEPARAADRLKLLKWENLARKRTKVTAELQSWLGMASATATNASAALAKRLADAVEMQQKSFNTLAKTSPISLQSLRIVEERCGPLMARLGFKATADVAADSLSGSTKKRRHAARSKKRGKDALAASDTMSTIDGSGGSRLAMEPLLLLRRRKIAASDRPVLWCPVRLTGAEALAKFFVGLDAPRAIRAPPCFPGSKEDVCPVPRAAAWPHARWGGYPFEVVEAPLSSPAAQVAAGLGMRRSGQQQSARLIEGGFSFAFVRNPWERLASAYSKLIAIEDHRTSIHRTWIREMHNLSEKEPIGFSHFVRWVVAQEPSSMHRAWRPFTRTCRFDAAAYSFIGRFESLADDVATLMNRLGMSSEHHRRIWQRANAETRPLVPHSHPDYLLKLNHLYYSDDTHDLVSIVRGKYKDDIEAFNYEFPVNETLAPWGGRVGRTVGLTPARNV